MHTIFEAIEYGFNQETGEAVFYCPTCKLPDKVKKANRCNKLEAIDTDRDWTVCPGYGLSHPLYSEVSALIKMISHTKPFDLDNQPQIVYNVWDWYTDYRARLETVKK